LRKKTNDYSRLQVAFANELYVDDGVAKKGKFIKNSTYKY
tara:strand:- start:465 stop:584 length:120 start_codon:yes stop_codon:yes gene_type:complete